jgi:arylsulfatase
VAYGVVADQATGFPGYNSVIPRDAVAIGEILRQNGYDTAWYGKDHNTPQWVASQAGPFTDWPTGPVKGFDYFYGFLGDDTSQWQPNNLFRNTTPIEPYLGKPGWNLITAMADEAVQRIRMMSELQPERPFMVYYAPGGTHAPHHPTQEWLDKITKMSLFDEGWNNLRERIFANQKRLGIVPRNAKLTDWPKSLAQWDTLTPEAKKLYIRQANVYAAYLAYSDHEIGRVIQAVQDAGKLDNTLVIYISGDNGSSPEGTIHGLYSEYAVANGVHPSVELNMKFYDAWGTDQTYPHYAAAWGVAWDTPYQYTKEVASHFGGTRRHGDGLAHADQGQGRHPSPVPSRHRHRADHPRSGRPAGTGDGQRHRAKADRGRQHGVHLGRRQRAGPADDAVLRDVRLARDLYTTAGSRRRRRRMLPGTSAPSRSRT